jgi:hypothetical protein
MLFRTNFSGTNGANRTNFWRKTVPKLVRFWAWYGVNFKKYFFLGGILCPYEKKIFCGFFVPVPRYEIAVPRLSEATIIVVSYQQETLFWYVRGLFFGTEPRFLWYGLEFQLVQYKVFGDIIKLLLTSK